MSTSNYPSAAPMEPRKNDYRGLIIGLLAVGLLGTWCYLLYSNNNNEKMLAAKETVISKTNEEKADLQRNFDAVIVRLDSVTGANNELQGKLTSATTEIASKKQEIRAILKKSNASKAELARAKELITQLNDKVAALEQQVADLTAQNTQLNTDLTKEKETTATLTKEKEDLTVVNKAQADKIDVASTFSAFNIQITPIDERRSGKEKVTTKAKRVDKLVISFDVENRIAPAGSADLYVCITGPDGKPITVEALGSGTFTTREEGDKLYTSKVQVDYETGKRKPVQFSWKQNSDFQRGNYKIEVYHNGYKIGDGVRELRKGGLFG